MKKRYSSIRGELIFFCVGVLVFSLVAQILCNGFFTRSLTIWNKERQLEELFIELSQDYNPDIGHIYSLVSDAQQAQNVRVLILDDLGEIVYSTDHQQTRESYPESIKRGDELREMPFNPAVDKPPQAQSDRELIRLEESIEYEGRIYTIVLMSSMVAIDSSVNLFTRVNIAVSMLVMLLGVLGVFVVARRFTRPLDNIRKVAGHVADLDFSVQANEDVSQKELQSLAVSINAMSHQLESMIDQLSADNETLSAKVEHQEQLEAMRRQFVANISHEMKTPLSMLMMYAESLNSKVPGIDKDYYCTVIMEEAAGLDAMVAQLLDISAIENGLLQMDMEQVDLSQFAGELTAKMQVLFEGRTLETDIEPDLLVKGDTKYLEQAMRNILSNASSHAPQDSTVAVALQSCSQGVKFSVHNQGSQIDGEDLPHLWDSFYRGDKSRTTGSEKRVGLGLYIVKTCVEAHGGQVHAENVTDGVTFSFTLPKV